MYSVQPSIQETIWAVTEAFGISPRLASGGRTNTNMAIFRDIPAVTLGHGGKEGGYIPWANVTPRALTSARKNLFCCCSLSRELRKSRNQFWKTGINSHTNEGDVAFVI